MAASKGDGAARGWIEGGPSGGVQEGKFVALILHALVFAMKVYVLSDCVRYFKVCIYAT